MKLRIYSDLHLEREGFVPPATPCDAVVLAGDVHDGVEAGVAWARAAFPGRPVVYVAGNHEHYGLAREDAAAAMRAAAAGSQVRVLEQQAWKIDDVRFLGCTLWSDFELLGDLEGSLADAQARGLDYREIRKFRASDARRAHARALSWLEDALEEPHDGPTVVVTHHAPSAISLPEHYVGRPRAAAYASHLDDLVERSGAVLWVHGHVHASSDYRIGETRVVCNPRGTSLEAGISFDPSFTVEI